MTDRNAVTLQATLQLLRWGVGSTDPTFDAATETLHALTQPVKIAAGTVKRHYKVVAGVAVLMTAPEQAVVDAATAVNQALAEAVFLQMFESNTTVTTGQETLQTAMSRTVAPLEAGAYRVQWAFEARVDPAAALDSRGLFNMSVDGSGVALNYVTLEDWQFFSGWDRYVAVDGGEPVLLLQFRRDPGVGGDDDIAVRRMKMSIEKLGTDLVG